MEKGEEEDAKRDEMIKRPFPFPLSTPIPLTVCCEYIQGVQGTLFRLPLKRIEDSRDGGMEGWREEVVQRSLCKLIRKKKSRYPISMDDGVSLVN